MKAIKSVKAKIRYHFEDDMFSARPLKRKYDSSVQIGEFIFDLDKEGKINGFEILNLSKLAHIPKAHLNSMKGVKIILEATENLLKIDIYINTVVRNAQKTSTLQIERLKPDFISPSHLNLAIA